MSSDTNLPVPQSYEQLLSDMLSAYATAAQINDFNVAAVNVSFFQVVALTVARASGDTFQILRDFSVDRATGYALQLLAAEYGITPTSASPTTGMVNIVDTSFNKIFTSVYAGTNAPNVGSITINVGDASKFPASGSIYIGRGTPNVEGPLPYGTPPVQTGTFWTITLSAPTAEFHNLGETVILAQGGNRVVPANTIVVSPGVGSSTDIQYGTVAQAIILDGETEVDNVQVTALLPGSTGNIPIGAIKVFASVPFTGATVSNSLPFTTGTDAETDDQLRVQIKNALASTGLGTATAIESSLLGATATESNGTVDTIVSDSLVTNTDGSATVYIDNGTGYEETSNGVGIESIIDSALGGEQFFQLQTGGSQAPVAKAFLQTTLSAPFDLIGGDTLAVVVGGVTYQHVFQNSDFVSPGGATAFEVTASINANTTLGFQATTAGGGIFVVINAIAETDDTIFVTTPTTSGRNAATLLGFPDNVIETLRLYKNNVPLTKDGSTASVFTQAQALWSPTIENGDTLILSVDGTSAITYTILDADFINTGLFPSVSATNTLQSWVDVFNNKLTGVTASIVGQQIELTSNLEANDRAQVVIDGSSTLVIKGMFASTIGLSSTGKASDFTLDRNTAQFELVVPLVKGDTLSAGSSDTEANIKSSEISGGSITLSSDGHAWILIDDAGQIIPTGVISNTTLSVSTPSANVVRYTSSVTNAFANVKTGDYVIIWSAELPVSDALEGRVHATTGNTLDMLITATEWAAVTVVSNVVYNQGFVVLRSNLAPQKFQITSGTNTLDQIVVQLQAQTDNLVFSVFLEEFLVVTSTTSDTTGSVLLVTADANGQLLEITAGTSGQSQTSLIASYDTRGYTGDLPLFLHSTFTAGEFADPPNSFLTSVSTAIALSPTDPNNLLCLLNPYGGIDDAQAYGESVQETSISGMTVGITEDSYVRRIRVNDRFYVGSPLNFGHQDTAVVIFDNNPVSETFTIPFYRNALTNTGVVSNPYNFDAYDFDAGPTASFTSTFGPNFNFANYKVLMQAKKVLKPTPSQTAILYRSTPWGESGEFINVGYIYPSAANAAIGSSVEVTSDVSILITLASGAALTTTINSSTQWNVTITANTPTAGTDQVTYTWNGTGTAPGLVLSGGEYVNITTQSGFNVENTGIFRVSTQSGFSPTATAFTVQRPTGVAVAETNIPTTTNGSISFYSASPTTAAQIVAYVNANLSQYVSATLVNDGGTSGSGVIVLSTYEDSGFTYSSVELLDGLNWIASSNLAASPQFVLKNALALPTDVGYAFNNGEDIRLIPTTMAQVDAFISVLAVSGFTTVGSTNLSDRTANLELSTDTLGSAGAIQIIGGTANEYEVPILGAGQLVNNTYMNVSVNSVASQGVHSGQWFKLVASNEQIKETGFSSNTSITVVGSDPVSGEATVTISGRTLTQRDFGKPRNHVRTEGDTFRVEKQGNLTCVSWTGVGTNPVFVKNPLNFNDAAGGTVNITPVGGSDDAQYVIAAGNTNFTELSIGDYITVSGMTNSANNGTFLVTGVSDDGKTIQVTNPESVAQTGVSFIAGNFTASSGVTEGDTVVISAPFNILNQGSFRVIREYNNSIWLENQDMVEEEVSLPYNPVNLGFDSSTVFSVNASNNSLLLEWTGSGTAPTLGNATMGDVITVGADFASGNQGSFMVLRSSPQLQQITQLTLPSGVQFTIGGTGTYFKTFNAGNANSYYVWYNVNGSNSDPAPIGFTGVAVAILSGDTPTNVASKTAAAINAGTTGLTAVATGNTVTITTTGFNATNSTLNVNVPSPFAVQTLQVGTLTFLEAINPDAVTDSSVTVTGILQDHRPQIQFSEYEATVAGDSFVATGSVLGSTNAGSYGVLQVLNRDTAVIKGILVSVNNASLNNNVTAVFVQEGTVYVGYKHVLFASAQPGAPTYNLLVFDTNNQYPKINQSAGVEMVSLTKLNFPTALKNGLDSYRYNTGLIQVANKIIYGDPRDPVTYPGVGAAGANIFVKAPLALRVQVAVDIRLLTGAPFNLVSQQVRTNVAYLINSNPVGQSIAISAIVSTIMTIPGVVSVAISSPQYNATNDLIQVTPSEKALIINPTTDISVSQIGT
jgi:hypothetical protein